MSLSLVECSVDLPAPMLQLSMLELFLALAMPGMELQDWKAWNLLLPAPLFMKVEFYKTLIVVFFL